MDDREELRRLIDVIEKGSGSGSLEQVVDDIKTFANTTSFLTNKLDTRLKGGRSKGHEAAEVAYWPCYRSSARSKAECTKFTV